MRSFTKGILVGIGVGLLFAPLTGEEMRHLLRERFDEFKNSLPEDSRLNQYVHEVSNRVEQTRGNLRGYTQQAVLRAKDTGYTLSNRALHTGQDLASKAKHTGQDMASNVAHKARQTGQDMAHKAKQTGQDMAHKARPSFTRHGGSSTGIMSEPNNGNPQE